MESLNDLTNGLSLLTSFFTVAGGFPWLAFQFFPSLKRGWRSRLGVLSAGLLGGVLVCLLLIPVIRWIRSPGSANDVAVRSTTETLQLAHDHLQTPGVDARLVRFLTLAHLDAPQANELLKEVQVRWPTSTVLGADRRLVAIDVRKIDWTRLTNDYPYGLRLENAADAHTARLAQQVRDLTGEDLFLVRAERAIGRVGDPVTLAVAARELGLSTPELLRRLQGRSIATPLLESRSIDRAEWENLRNGPSLFQRIAHELELGTPLGRSELVLD
jgi:hypothetical protein